LDAKFSKICLLYGCAGKVFETSCSTHSPDQRKEVGLIELGENDPAVFALEEIALVVIIKFWASDGHRAPTRCLLLVDPNRIAITSSGAACIDQHTCLITRRAAVFGRKRDLPNASSGVTEMTLATLNPCATRLGITMRLKPPTGQYSIQQSGILYPSVGRGVRWGVRR
jgi:hypothetical protein